MTIQEKIEICKSCPCYNIAYRYVYGTEYECCDLEDFLDCDKLTINKN